MQVNNNRDYSSHYIPPELSKRKRVSKQNYTRTDPGPGPSKKRVRSSDEEDQAEGETSSNESWATTTKVESLVELKCFLSEIQCFNFKERISALKSHMSPKEDHHDLYVELTCAEQLSDIDATSQEEVISIKLSLQKQRFKSSTFTEANLRSGRKRNQKFYVLRAYEYIEDDQYPEKSGDVRIMKLYSSQNGLKGELAWIQNGYKLTGNTLAKLYELMRDVLPIETTYLFDDANKYLPLAAPPQEESSSSSEDSSKPRVLLRTLKVLSSPEDNGLSWYQEKWGFSAIALTKFKTQEHSFTQNPATYVQAITHIRETPLAAVQAIHQEHAEKIGELIQRYPSKRIITSKTPLTMRRKAVPTVHGLVKIMAEAERIPQTKQQAQKDLHFLFEKVIDNISPRDSEEGEAFRCSLEEIEGMRIFTRKNA